MRTETSWRSRRWARPGAWLLALLVAMAALLGAGTAQAEGGGYPAGYRRVTLQRAGGGTFTAILLYPATQAGPNTPYDGSGAPYPAIAFGHGYQSNPALYQSTLAHLTGAGYFVIAPESALGPFPDHALFADDLQTSLSFLETQSATPGSPLFGQVDTANFGLSGHSMGGGASLLAAAEDPRIRAVANLAAAETSPSAIAAMAEITIPVSLIAGNSDDITPLAQHVVPMYNNGNAPRQSPVLDGGWHCGFLDRGFGFFCDSGPMPRATQLALTQAELTRFFNLYLKGDQSPWREVWGPEADDNPQILRQTASGIALNPPTQGGQAAAGATRLYTVTVTNNAPVATSYTMLAEGNGWTTLLSPAQTAPLNPGQSTVVQVQVQVPIGASGSDTALVSARADRDGGTRGFATISTTVQP